MIIWSGRGFLSVLVLIATLFVCISIFPDGMRDYGFIVSLFVAGIFSWLFGKKWNSKNERIVIDEQSGERLKIKNNHSLFWIPMQYWGVIFSVLAIVILFQNSLVFGIISATILLAFITIPLFTFQKKHPKKIAGLTSKNKVPIEVKKTSNSSDIISELKKEKVVTKEFKESDHSKFMPK
ncbi:hypothetical protein [Maribacter sp. IgM3_T14_3]|uniref:hypothetical protein n=1 Tax=Maribacter sp. IgM3_T14_3 TaxID=3415140 RepID=UPI003C70428E